jgi:iron(III) transport system ATP-binding protein
VLEPSVMLFDEPLSNLDARLRRSMREEIRSLQQRLKLTVAYVTHDQSEALAVSDQIVVMNAGLIAQAGTPQQLYEAPAQRVRRRLHGRGHAVQCPCLARTGPLLRADRPRLRPAPGLCGRAGSV